MHTRIYDCVYLAVGLARCRFCTLGLLLSVKIVFWDTVQRRGGGGRATWSKPHTALSVSSGQSGSGLHSGDVSYYSPPEDTTAMIAVVQRHSEHGKTQMAVSCMGWHVY